MKKDKIELKAFLEEGDAEKCMLGEQCVSLGIEIVQLRANIRECSFFQGAMKSMAEPSYETPPSST